MRRNVVADVGLSRAMAILIAPEHFKPEQNSILWRTDFGRCCAGCWRRLRTACSVVLLVVDGIGENGPGALATCWCRGLRN